ncbi:MAG: radical SAM protein [Firmicutes bacterium]|nr:radical SAM protein [Bacillota bacterium]
MPGSNGWKVKGTERLFNLALDYLVKDPEKRIRSLLSIGKALAVAPNHKEVIANFETRLDAVPSTNDYLRRLLTQVHPNYRKGFLMNLIVKASLWGIPKQAAMTEELGVKVPYTILIDPTEACNLRCVGCWAGKYQVHTLPYETFDRILKEAQELGIHFIVLSGGEPFAYKNLLRAAEEHPDIAFMAYTNGTLIDEEIADRLVATGNLSPVISLEGWREETDARRGAGVYDKVMTTMDLLRERGVLFGCSITATRHNVATLFADEFIDHMIAKGAMYAWSFHYVPVGREPNMDLMITPEQRSWLVDRVAAIRDEKSFPLIDFWNDGEMTGGCIAGGRMYFHITADGQVEPCAFAHFSMENIKDKSLVEVLGSPLFKAYRKHQLDDNMLLPCPIIDRPEKLRQIVLESGAKPSYPDAAGLLDGELADALDHHSQAWRKVCGPIWARRKARKQSEVCAG